VKLGLSQSVRLEQRLVQSPQMIQAMQILQLSGLDLLDRIQQELVENPFLEVEEVKEESAGEASAEAAGTAESAAGETGTAEGLADGVPGRDEPDRPEPERVETGDDRLVEELERLESESYDGWSRKPSDGEDGDKKLEAMANTPAGEKSLADALLEEFSFLDLDARSRKIAEYVAYSLDDRGYLTQTLEEIASEVEAEERGEDGVAPAEAAVQAEVAPPRRRLLPSRRPPPRRRHPRASSGPPAATVRRLRRRSTARA
jgi:RNA polymerase sigma-54 factor